MKLSSIILAAAFLGVIFPLGARWLDPLDRLIDGDPRMVRTVILDGGHRIIISSNETARVESRELTQLKTRLAQAGRRIREGTSALRRIESSEGELQRRMKELKRRERDAQALMADEQVIAALHRSEAALLDNLEAVARENRAFQGFLERLKNEQASLKVKIALWDVTEERMRMEKFLHGEAKGPVDDLSRALKQRSLKKPLHGTIAY